MLALLGNTGSRYARTRHNIAWKLTGIAPFDRNTGWQRKFKAEWTQTTIAGHRVVLLLPQVMMNLSGESVQAAARFFRYPPDEIAVVHDDVELTFGRAAIRLGGGLAGHNGLRSVATSLSTREFWRVRIGIGRPTRGDLHNHVLGRFSPEEDADLPRFLTEVSDLITDAFRDGWTPV